MLLRAEETRPMDGGPSFSLGNRAYRALWGFAWALLCAWNPRFTLWRWRAFVVRVFGGNVDPTARIYPSARIWSPANLTMAARACLGAGATCYSQGRVTIGEGAVVSQGAHLCTGSHDVSDPHFQLVVRPIDIGAGAWIAAEAFVGPGVTVGEGAVLGARGVAFTDLKPGSIYLGNPATLKRDRPTAPSERRPR